ncbi:hypothetical protein HDV02_003132 [Globomyces sp. JEL0801]|nr:hypothetical protein HDV02_003132 [Globomyces sp. JEL0801]
MADSNVLPKKVENQKPLGSIASWYKPDYDYDAPELTMDQKATRPRYCNGRMSRGGFICANICALISIFLVVFIPVTYFVLVPNFFQHKIDMIGINGDTIRIHKTVLGPMQDGVIPFEADIRHDPIVSFPLQGGFKAQTIDLMVGGKDGKVIAQLNMPPMEFNFHEELHIKANGTLTMNGEQQQNTRAFIKQFSSAEGIKNLDLYVRMNPAVTAHGMTVYSSLPLHRAISLTEVAASTKYLLSPWTFQNPFLFNGPDPAVANKALYSMFKTDEITKLPANLGGFEFVWKALTVGMNDNGASTGLGLAFGNPTPIAAAKMETLSFYLSLEDTKVAKLSLKNLALDLGFNPDVNTGMEIAFIDEAIDPKAVQLAIEKASKSFADKLDFNFAMVGPISITNAGFISTITQDLKLRGSLADILRLAPDAVKSFLKNPTASVDTNALTKEAINIIGNSTITLNVLNDKMSAALGLNLPQIDFIKVPKNIGFPYTSSISIYANDAKVIQNDVSPITIARQTNGLFINVTATVTPQNTDAAAQGLANAINPILAFNATSSSIGIKDLAFNTPGAAPFKWCTQLFGDRVLNIGIPAINKTAVLDMVLNAGTADAMSKLSKLAIGDVSLSQLTDRPGFGAQGNVVVSYPPGLPQLNVDLGYASVDNTVEDVKLAGLELPSGLKFFPQQKGTDINGALVLNRDEKLEGKIQKFADALLKDGEMPSYVGITGIKFGVSAQNHFQTFSKIVLNLDTTTIKDFATKLLAKNPAPSINLATLLPEGMIKATGLSAIVKSSTEMALGLDASVNNPFGISLSMGSISIDAALDGKKASSVSVSALSITKGNNNVKSEVAVKLSTGANGMDAAVAKVANDVLKKDTNSKTLVGVSNLVLTPANIKSPTAVIDHFKNIAISTELGKLLKLVEQLASSASGPSPLDISALLPTADILTKLNPEIKFLQLAVQENQVINAGVDVTYTNPLPIKIELPYAAISASIGDAPAVDVVITSIQIEKTSGTAKPRLSLGFKQNVSDKMALLVTNFLNGKLDQSLKVGKIYFGSSASDRNDILSAVSIDSTPLIAPVVKTLGPQVQAFLNTLSATVSLKKRADPLLSIKGPLGISAVIKNVDLEMKSDLSLSTGVSVDLTLPFLVDIDVPYTGASIFLDDTQTADISLTGMKIKGNAGTLNLVNVVKLIDSDSLAAKASGLLNAVLNKASLPGNVNIGNMVIGASSSNVIDGLSGIVAGLPLAKIQGLLGNSLGSSSLDINALVAKLGLGISNIGMKAIPGRAIEFNAAANLNLPFPISLKGVGYISATAGVDNVELMTIEAGGVNIVPGQNQLSLSSKATFLSSTSIQDKVAGFVNNVLTNFGKTEEKFVVSKLAIGVDSKNYFKFLSGIKLGVPSTLILNQKTLDLVKSQVGNGPGLNATVKSVAMEMKPDLALGATLVADIALPFSVDVDLPYTAGSIYLDETRGLDLSLTGLAIKGKSATLTLTNNVVIVDSDELGTKVAGLLNGLLNNVELPGTIKLSNMALGVSASDAIDTFAKAKPGLPIMKIKELIGQFIPKLPSIDPAELAKKLAITISNVAMKTIPGKAIQLDAAAGINVPFPISLKGVGYIAATAGVDNIDVVTVEAGGVTIVPGQNQLSLSGKTTFLSATSIQDKVAAFVKNVLGNFGNTEEVFSLSKLAVGVDSKTYFKFLSKIVLKIQSKNVLNPNNLKLVLGQLGNSTDLLKKVTLSKLAAHAASDDQVITAGLGLTVADIPFNVALKVGFADATVIVDQETLLGFSLIGNGLNAATADKKLTVDVSNSLALSNDPKMAGKVGALVQTIIHDIPIENMGGVKGLTMGSDRDPKNIIDTFAKVEASIKLEPYVKQIRELLKSTIANPPSLGSIPALKDLKIKPKELTLDVFDEETLVLDIKLDMSGFPIAELDLNIPFLTATLQLDKKDFVINKIIETKVSSTSASMKVFLAMPDNFVAAQTLMTLVGDIAFDRNHDRPIESTITVKGLGLGPSEAKQVKLLSAVFVDIGPKWIKKGVTAATDFARPISILDIQASIEHAGIQASATLPDLGIPLQSKASLTSTVKYSVNGQPDPRAFLTMATATSGPFQLPSLDLLTSIPTNTTAFFPALGEIMTKAMSWKSIADNARLGFVVLTGSNGKEFKRLSNTFIAGPTGISLTETMRIYNHNATVQERITPDDENGFGEATSNLFVTLLNNSPLHLDMGELSIWSGFSPATGGSPDPDVEIFPNTQLYLKSIGNFVLKNKNEGGNIVSDAGYPTHGTFTAQNFAWITSVGGNTPDGYSTLFKNGWDRSQFGSVRAILRSRRNGVNVDWFSNMTSLMEDVFFMGQAQYLVDYAGSHIGYQAAFPYVYDKNTAMYPIPKFNPAAPAASVPNPPEPWVFPAQLKKKKYRIKTPYKGPYPPRPKTKKPVTTTVFTTTAAATAAPTTGATVGVTTTNSAVTTSAPQ